MEYKADRIFGKQRCNGGSFKNPLNGTPCMTFDEELAITVDEQVKLTPAGSCTATLSDPNKVLILRSPVDNSIIRESTYAEAFIYNYSLYIQTATERDAVLFPKINPPVITSDPVTSDIIISDPVTSEPVTSAPI